MSYFLDIMMVVYKKIKFENMKKNKIIQKIINFNVFLFLIFFIFIKIILFVIYLLSNNIWLFLLIYGLHSHLLSFYNNRDFYNSKVMLDLKAIILYH